jgi:hypothetical protein
MIIDKFNLCNKFNHKTAIKCYLGIECLLNSPDGADILVAQRRDKGDSRWNV